MCKEQQRNIQAELSTPVRLGGAAIADNVCQRVAGCPLKEITCESGVCLGTHIGSRPRPDVGRQLPGAIETVSDTFSNCRYSRSRTDGVQVEKVSVSLVRCTNHGPNRFTNTITEKCLQPGPCAGRACRSRTRAEGIQVERVGIRDEVEGRRDQVPARQLYELQMQMQQA